MRKDLEDGWFIDGGGIIEGHVLFHRHSQYDDIERRRETGESIPGYVSAAHVGVGVKLKKSKGDIFCNRCGKKAPPYAEDLLMLTCNPQIPDHAK